MRGGVWSGSREALGSNLCVCFRTVISAWLLRPSEDRGLHLKNGDDNADRLG